MSGNISDSISDNIIVSGNKLTFKGKKYDCAIGKNGISNHKREGDNLTPKGTWAIREVLYRADKIDKPSTKLKISTISEDDGWCDDPKDENYNKPVKLPHTASHEKLWREDNLYNIVIILGYNDAPPINHKGSAIFMHIAKPNYEGTEGCVALKIDDLKEVLNNIEETTEVEIN